MNLMVLALAVAAAAVVVITLVILIPMATRERYSSRLFELARQLDDHLDRGDVPRHEYVERTLDAIYFFAEHPTAASMQVALYPVIDTQEIDRELADFKRTAPAKQAKTFNVIFKQFTQRTVRQTVYNSFAWAPLLALIHILHIGHIATAVPPSLSKIRADLSADSRKLLAATC